MTKLTGYNKVAVVKIGCITYHLAIYEDGFEYQPGDKVYTSGQCDKVVLIDDIISPEEAAQRLNGNITAEVICKIDTSAYDERVNKRKIADKIKKKMDVMIEKMKETNKYEMYAERNPDLKNLLNSYKKLVG